MAIKSAYELAMERARDIKIDKDELKRKEFETVGKEAASQFLFKPKYNFEEWLEGLDKDNREYNIKGVAWVFKKNIKLPNSTADIDNLIKIKNGYQLISDEKDTIEELFSNLINVYQQFIENSKTLLEQCKTEFAPRLQKKAMLIAQQTGQMIPIEPETDRDFIEFHKDQQGQLDEHYQQYIDQVLVQLDTII